MLKIQFPVDQEDLRVSAPNQNEKSLKFVAEEEFWEKH